MKKPITKEHDGILVVRDDLHAGGTKARFLRDIIKGATEAVYASPAEGGAQTALAQVAHDLKIKATIFVAKRTPPHPRALMAKALGAQVVQIAPGYLTVVQARARAYCEATGAMLLPFGVDTPEALEAIASAARALKIEPDEVWCASGSGVLARGLALAWPKAKRHVVQVGRELTPKEVAGAEIHVFPKPFGYALAEQPPFPSDRHYDAKAWQICKARHSRTGLCCFWNVLGPAA